MDHPVVGGAPPPCELAWSGWVTRTSAKQSTAALYRIGADVPAQPVDMPQPRAARADSGRCRPQPANAEAFPTADGVLR